ncbi:MAG: Collagen triple helix repeat protein [Candidatus Moranbacteria bacterium GW2011_GWE1_35_17]|nr:MAG: Collagen triple helix repeat protein [Candidatus Moranbacteria bacterium GW2011_GWE1_35_17]KKP85181.1 MAG: Collagen triple helix repeat protein [Candidatus Moranbacteria bacterium GW2011_GWF2_35_54]
MKNKIFSAKKYAGKWVGMFFICLGILVLSSTGVSAAGEGNQSLSRSFWCSISSWWSDKCIRQEVGQHTSSDGQANGEIEKRALEFIRGEGEIVVVAEKNFLGENGQQGQGGADGQQGQAGGAGSVGVDGQNGLAGQQGQSGITGAQGIGGEQGIIGSIGLAGQSGANGVDGQAGTAGITGSGGAQGATGQAGTQGERGSQGIQGSQGSVGSDGKDGEDGEDGTDGEDGADASSIFGSSIDSAEITDGTIAFSDWASNSCIDNQIPKYNTTSGSWECGNDMGGTTVYVAGNGLNLSGNEFSVLLNGSTLAVSASGLKVNAIGSTEITDGSLANADISTTAAIAWTKLNKTGAVLTDVGIPSYGGNSNKTLTVNSSENGVEWINTLNSALADGKIFIGNASGVATGITMFGDATLSNTGALAISANAVALGNDTAGNYIATITNGGGLTVTGSGSETANITLALDIDGLTGISAVANDDYLALYDTSSSGIRKISRNDFLSGITGSLIYQGTWDASGATPDTCAIGIKGHYYVATTVGSGHAVGDWTICNGTSWEKLTNSITVASVFGRTGAVTTNSGDYNASQITNTAGGNIVATNVQNAINELDSEKLDSSDSITDLDVPAYLGNTGKMLVVNGTSDGLTWSSALTTTLASGSIFVGDGTNTAVAAIVSGDATLGNTGVLTIADDAVALGADTTGNYINGATSSGGLTLTGTEGGTLGILLDGNTLSLGVNGLAFNLANANTWSGTQTFGNAIIAPTSTNTVNGLVISSGALAAITGYAQTSGNFAQSGVGTFSTGSGAISLNGNATVATGKTLTLTDLTQGSLLFAGASGVVSEDLGTLYWSAASNRLGIGTDAPTNALTFASGSTIDSLGALSMTTASSGALSLTANGSGIITLSSGSGAINIGSSGTGAINLGTGSSAKTITIGNVTGATALNFNTGTGGSTFTTANGAFALNTGAGAINLGTDATAKTITIGNTTGATGLVFNSGTGNMNFDSDTLYVDAVNDRVGIGTNSIASGSALQVRGGSLKMDDNQPIVLGTGSDYGRMWYAIANTDFLLRNGGSGGVYLNDPGATSWTSASDSRLKKDVVSLDSSILEKILNLNPVSFYWKSGEDKKRQIGFIAQEVETAGLGDVVVTPKNPDNCIPGSETANDCYGISYDKFAPYLVKAIQEQQSQILDNVDQITTLDLRTKNIVSSEDGKTVFKGIIVADSIKANRIEGLEFVTTQLSDADAQLVKFGETIANLTNEIANLDSQMADLSSSFKVKNLEVLSLAKLKELSVSGAVLFKGDVEFQGLASFKKDVEFSGKVMFDEDSAGYAIIKSGETKVEVRFEKEYVVTPIITTTLRTGINLDWYRVTDESTRGFVIEIDPEKDKDIKFAWTAVAVRDVKTTESDNGLAEEENSQTPSETALETPAITPEIISESETIVEETPIIISDEESVSEQLEAPATEPVEEES